MDLPLLPCYRPLPLGDVIAETDDFKDGDGIKATMTAYSLLIEVRVNEGEGEAQMHIPITTLLEAIAERNHDIGS